MCDYCSIAPTSDLHSLPLPFYWREFPGHPVVRTLCFHCWGLSSIPGRGIKIVPGS